MPPGEEDEDGVLETAQFGEEGDGLPINEDEVCCVVEGVGEEPDVHQEH